MKLQIDGLGDRFGAFIREAKDEVVLVAPYASRAALDHLIQYVSPRVPVTLLTTWRVRDLVLGASDLHVYPLLKSRGGFVYLLEDLHAKLVVLDWDEVLVTSANITRSGLGLSSAPNVEVATSPGGLDSLDQCWIRGLLQRARLVTDEIHGLYMNHIEAIAVDEPNYPELELPHRAEHEDFLLTALPMSDTPTRFFEELDCLQQREFDPHSLDVHAAIHDAALYGVWWEARDHAQQLSNLRVSFFDHPFIVALVRRINDGLYFGEAKAWVQSTCADVPVPKRRELTGHVRVLFDWVVELGDGRFCIKRPRHSECLVDLDR